MNPNLYANGKVCLSLLGTWQGPGWDPKTSTLLQARKKKCLNAFTLPSVLVSIQSLIFVAEPYFNEPGYEATLGTPQGAAGSQHYNSGIRNATLLFAVVAVLKSKTGPYRDVARSHFRLLRSKIYRTLNQWQMDAFHRGGKVLPMNGGCNGDAASMSSAASTIFSLLRDL
ncbi:unnamed protein product [Choristocarpus tenellus]